MNTISLVKSDQYLLGIPARHITKRVPLAEFARTELSQEHNEVKIIHLGSFLNVCPSLSIQEQSILLQMRALQHPIYLIVDRMVDDIEEPEEKHAIPRLYPELTAQLCPQIFLHQSNIIMRLDPTQLLPVLEKTGHSAGLVSIQDLSPATGQSQNDNTTDNTSVDTHHSSDTTPIIDDETFGQVVTWTINQFKKRRNSDNPNIQFSELPQEIVKTNKLNAVALQYLIDQVIDQCRKRYQH